MEITYLTHSGFACLQGHRLFVFDYWRDPKKGIDEYLAKADEIEAVTGKPLELWFFVTHIHGDHFNPQIARFDSAHTKYILEEEIRNFTVPKGAVYSMAVDEEITIDDVTIHCYGSTDAGGSYLIRCDGWSLFHAGDLNWWHWLGDSEENNREARRFFERELRRMDGLAVDVAMFPVDARLEEAREWGVLEWLSHVTVKKLFIPMHMHDVERGGWQPSEKFLATVGDLPLWIPKEDGEKGIFYV